VAAKRQSCTPSSAAVVAEPRVNDWSSVESRQQSASLACLVRAALYCLRGRDRWKLLELPPLPETTGLACGNRGSRRHCQEAACWSKVCTAGRKSTAVNGVRTVDSVLLVEEVLVEVYCWSGVESLAKLFCQAVPSSALANVCRPRDVDDWSECEVAIERSACHNYIRDWLQAACGRRLLVEGVLAAGRRVTNSKGTDLVPSSAIGCRLQWMTGRSGLGTARDD
jgi:hypothetical protein